MKTSIVIAFVVVLASGSAWWLWRDSAAEVVVETVKQGEIKHSSPGRVHVLPQRLQVLKSLRPGRVKSVFNNLEPKSESLPVAVKEGEVLVQLATRDVELALEKIRVGLRAAEARLQLHEHNQSEIAPKLAADRQEVKALEDLAENGRYPKAELRKKKAQITILEAQLIREKEEWEEQKISLNEKVDTARVEEAQALRHLEELSIKAPFTGILTEIRVSPGDTVSLVEPLGVLQSKKHLVEVTLLEEDFQGIEANQSVAISFRSEGTAIFHGKISGYSGASGYFDANGFSDNRRRIFVDMADGNERFAVGSTGEAEIIKAYKRDVVLVPRRALVGENLCIWKNGSIEVRKVKIGIHNLLVAEALDGLEFGERVVVDTPHLFRDGQRARLAGTQK